MSSEKWDAGLYDAKHAFVWEKADFNQRRALAVF